MANWICRVVREVFWASANVRDGAFTQVKQNTFAIISLNTVTGIETSRKCFLLHLLSQTCLSPWPWCTPNKIETGRFMETKKGALLLKMKN